jgi:SAM-dependent methyltransferase
MDATHEHHQNHQHPNLDEADWDALAAKTERQGEVMVPFVSDTARRIAKLRPSDDPPIRRILDLGSGPGVAACELALLFPDAHVTAVDASPAMLERTQARALRLNMSNRISTHLAELPDGLGELDHADLIWASMSLHHVGNEVNALRLMRDRLTEYGLLAIAEVADPTRVLPDDIDVGRAGFTQRLDQAESDWFAAMRANLPGSSPSADLHSMIVSAGFEIIDARVARLLLEAPLSGAARQVVWDRFGGLRRQLNGFLNDDDLHALDVLSDVDDPRCVLHRTDVFLATSQNIVIARPGPA